MCADAKGCVRSLRKPPLDLCMRRMLHLPRQCRHDEQSQNGNREQPTRRTSGNLRH